jgi:hypothetical protein
MTKRHRVYLIPGFFGFVNIGKIVYFAHVQDFLDPLHLPWPDGKTKRELCAVLDRKLVPKDNDGVVPALSQVWGELICATRADHLDAIGHFSGKRSDSEHTHYDWFSSGSGFDRARFESLWRGVARFVATADA